MVCLSDPSMFSSLVFGLSLSIYTVIAGVSVTSSNTGVPDISGSVYTKTQVITDFKWKFTLAQAMPLVYSVDLVKL